MKNKFSFSEATPPRHKGLFARFFALFFCLVMGMNVWGAEVKLIDNGSLNTTDFRTTVSSLTNENYSVDGTSFTKCMALASTNSTMVGVYDAAKYIAYDSKTDATEVTIYLYNKNSSAKNFTYIVIPEGGTATQQQVSVAKGSGQKIVIPMTGRSSLYCSTASGDVRFCQIIANETGSALVKSCKPGYSINFKNPRFALKDNSGKSGSFDGFEINSNQALKLLSGTSGVELYTDKTNYIKFTLTETTNVEFTATIASGAAISFNNSKAYNAAENSFTAEDQNSVVLTAGTWYINPNGKKTQITKLEFEAVHSVTFDKNGATSADIEEQFIEDGKKATKPADPEKTGFDFVNWIVKDSDPEVVYDFDDAVTADVALIAKWQTAVVKEHYAITYNPGANGTGSIAPGDKTEDVAFTLSSERFTRDGYVQIGWATTDGGAKAYAVGGEYTANAAIELFPVWGHLVTDAPSLDVKGDVTIAGLEANGWYFTHAGTVTDAATEANTAAFFATAGVSAPGDRNGIAIAKNTNAYAQYDLGEETTVTDVWATLLGGSSSAFNETIEYLDASKNVVKSYTNSLGAGNWAANDIHKTDIVDGVRYIRVKGASKWVMLTTFAVKYVSNANFFTVTFDMQGATSAAIADQSVKEGGKATKPADPEKTGFDFVKWVVASTEADYDFDAAVTADVALKAIWEEADPCDAFEVTCTNGQLEPFEEWLEYTRDQNQSTDIWSFNLVAVTGGTAATYEWYRNTEKSHEGVNLVRWNQDTDPGYTSQYSKLPAVDVAGTFYYFCKVTSTTGCEAYSKYITYTVNAAASSEKKLTRALFSNGFDAFINETAHTVTAYYLNGETAPTLSVGSMTVSAAATAAIDGTTITVTAEDGTTQDYTVTLEAVTPAAVGEYTFDAVPSWVKAPYGYDASKGIKFAKNAEDGRIQLGNTRQYYFVEACEKLVLHTASGITSDRNIFVYVNNVKVDAITKAPKYDAAGSYIEIPCNGSAAMVAVVSNQTGGDGGFGKAEIVAHVVSSDATLSALFVADNTIAPTFDAATYNYTCKLPYGTEAVPAVSYILNDVNATAVKTDAASVTGTTTIVVTAEDGTTQLTYTIQFSVAAAPAATPTITTQPVGHDYLDTEVIAALTVEATVSDAGVLSYQWYKGEDVIAEATAATYTPTEAGSYKVVVTNTLGEETAEATSDVAVINITHIYTFDAWDGASTTFTKTGEWTLYPYNKDNRWVISDQKFRAEQAVSATDAAAKANVFTDQYFLVNFAKDMQEVLVKVYYSGSDRTINDIYTVETLGDASTSTKGSSAVSVKGDYTIDAQGRDAAKVSTTTITGLFETGVNYVFKVSGTSGVMFEFIATAATEKSADPAVATLVTETVCSDGTFATLDAVTAAEATYSYQWYKDDAEFATTQTINPTDGGAYYCKVTNSETDKRAVTKETNKVTLVRLTSGTTVSVEDGLAKTGETVELTATAAGAGTLTYAWYTCDDAEGTNPVEIAGADEAIYTATVGTETAYYMVEVTGDCGTASAVATVNVQPESYELQDVTKSTTWNWNNAGVTEIKLTSETTPAKYDEFLLANAENVVNNGDFESDKLLMYSEYLVRDSKYCQGHGLKFHTTVAGFITVKFSNTGNRSSEADSRYLTVNGETTTFGSWKSGETVTTDPIFVPAGYVELGAVLNDAVSDIRIYSVTFTAADAEYTRDVVAGNYSGFCIDKAVAANMFAGAEFYTADCKTTDGSAVTSLTLRQVDHLEAGVGYICLATANKVYMVTNGDPAAAATEGTIIGAYERTLVPENQGMFVILSNKLYECGLNCHIKAGSAYINMSEVSETPSSAPGRRRVIGSTNQTDTATGMDGVSDNDNVNKMLINGQLFIIRGGKMFNAAGVLVK